MSGKWGNGGRGSTGVPEKHGFDVFVGYYDQVHAHSYYPPYLIRNSEEMPLAGNRGNSDGQTYSQYADMLYASPAKSEDNLDVVTTVNAGLPAFLTRFATHTSMPSARFAARATPLPRAPWPTMPSLRPASSRIG